MGASRRQDHSAGGCPSGATPRHSWRPTKAAAYTLLELQVALVILGAGLLAMPPLMAMQSRQIRHVEAWCRSEPTFYVVSQSNRWLRRMEVPAEMEAKAGVQPWAPPVTGIQVYNVELRSMVEHLDKRTIRAKVKLKNHGG